MPKIKPSNVDEYIDAAPLFAQEKLREIRFILRKVAPLNHFSKSINTK
jgi:hypothetical protein